MASDIDILGQGAVFCDLETEDLEELLSQMECRPVQEGEHLTEKGSRAACYFILKSGMLLIAMKEGRSLIIDQPGEFIGFETLASDGVYENTVIALCRGEIWVIPREDFLSLVRQDTNAAAAIVAAWQTYLNDKAPFLTPNPAADLDYQY